MQFVRPKALQRGETISVVAPSGPVDRPRLERALGRLQALGYRVKMHGDVFRSRGYLAGDDSTRAGELMDAFADRESTAVWCARGGYGAVRLLDRLDFDLIERKPKVFVGFSDITALHLAIHSRTGMITFHGPILHDGLGGPDGLSAGADAALWRAIVARAGFADATDDGYVFAENGVDGVSLRAITRGVAAGRLTGGNLSVLCSLMGTPYEIDTAGQILLLEDVNEPIYRIDRFLAQLALAGKLRSAAGILLGSFTFDQKMPPDFDSGLAELFQEYFGGLSVPVVAGAPIGHQRENWTLPLNELVSVDAEALRVSVNEKTISALETTTM